MIETITVALIVALLYAAAFVVGILPLVSLVWTGIQGAVVEAPK